MKKFLLLFFLFLAPGTLFLYFYRHQLPTKNQVETFVEEIAPQPTTIVPTTGLPNRHLIKAAFIPQAPEKNWDEPWQDACEEAALLNVYYYYEQQNPTIAQMLATYQQLFDYEKDQGWSHDINLSQMATISSQLWGYQNQIVDNPTLFDLKKFISQNIPIIVPANGKTLFAENKNFKNGGPWYHNLVILGYDDDKSEFTVHDVGTRLGAYFKYSYDLLLRSIHDFPASTSKENIDQGVPRVLILLK